MIDPKELKVENRIRKSIWVNKDHYEEIVFLNSCGFASVDELGLDDFTFFNDEDFSGWEYYGVHPGNPGPVSSKKDSRQYYVRRDVEEPKQRPLVPCNWEPIQATQIEETIIRKQNQIIDCIQDLRDREQDEK
jgi:hypothetical protein